MLKKQEDDFNINKENVEIIYQRILAEKSKSESKQRNSIIAKLEQSKYFEDILINKDLLNPSKELLFSIVTFINYKLSHRINVFENIRKSKLEEKFNQIFNEILQYDLMSLNDIERVIFLQFLINCFQHIEEKFISSNCLKLVSILLWLNLSKETIKNLLMDNDKLIDKWKMIIQLSKREDIVNTKSCGFFNKLLEDFLFLLENVREDENSDINMLDNYANSDPELIPIDMPYLLKMKFVEFLIDLLSQYSTRKFLLPLIKEKHFYERCILFANSANEPNHESSLLRKMLESLKFYLEFEINEETGENLSPNSIFAKHYSNINHMQNITFQLFPDKLSRIYLKNISLIDNTENIKDMLDILNEEELLNFSNNLNLLKYTRDFYINKKDLIYQIFLSKYERKETVLEKINNMPLYPDEKLIWDKELIPDEFNNGSMEKSIPIPKLNLQFLTHYDYLLRNFNLFRYESIYEIRGDIEDVINRMHPQFDNRGNFSQFKGWARMGVPIKNLKILTIKPALIGNKYPQEIVGEIEINLKGVQTEIKNEWDRLKRYDVLFLSTFKSNSESKYLNVKHVRGCEVIRIYDEENSEFSDFENLNKKKPIGIIRRIHVSLDPIQYFLDLNDKKLNVEEMYSNFHLVIRRKPEQNNFKAILDTIRDLMNSITVIPNWLEKIFLGYGDPNGAHYTKITSNKNIKINLFDTFINKEHFEQNFLKNEYIPEERKSSLETLKNLPSKRNEIKFTKKQIEAIYSGVNNGLTLIVGPPGTGKTDVAVQIVNLLYHNFPNQRTLIVTHSNYALNDIFEKIACLDIDERYLLRLGMGEKDLSFEKDFSKNGRVNYMLQRRIELLSLVLQLAHSLEVFTFEEYTCEHALNFYQFEVIKRIENFNKFAASGLKDIKVDNDNKFEEFFPFKKFFNTEENLTSELCQNYIKYLEDLFSEIEELRAFELLRNNMERGNHLLTKQTKIIAMTCTHAALKRKEFIKLGLQYDNIIMEEAAQILEVETFIPMLLQNNKSEKETRLKRVVLIGDNNQLTPIIKNNAFKQYGRMDQSLFNRFIRTGVPYIALDWQGRTRPSIVDLYRWNYEKLCDLPNVLPNDNETSLFNYKNAGFTHEFQFINVPDFDFRGESCPSPYYYQNLAEAEYIIATFMFMCLIGYDPQKITILTTYNGQKALLKDIYKQKCSWNPIFNSPAKITTVDKYQGQQNDYVLLSLVRTSYAGHIRDIRRLIVSLSRGRLGLFVFGRWSLFSNLNEMSQSFKVFSTKPQDLTLHMGEQFPSRKRINEIVIKAYSQSQYEVVIQDFQHMYRVVQELMKIKFASNVKAVNL